VITVELDSQTAILLDKLKKQLHDRTNEGVIRKAIALLAQVVELSGNERYFILKTPSNETIRINLD
jgi:hypothetical protein